MSKTAADVLSLVADEGYEFVDLRFCDLPGQVQHFTVPVKQLTEDSFEDGFGFDGSSIPRLPADPGIGHDPDPGPGHRHRRPIPCPEDPHPLLLRQRPHHGHPL